MKKNIIVIFPIILSVITVAIFFNLSVKPMNTTTNVLGQKETMSQNENSKKNTIGNAAQNNSNSKSIGSNTGNSSDESKSSGSGQTTTKDSSTVATTAPANTIKLSFVGDCLCATDENTSYENCFNDVAKAKNPSYFLEKVNSYFLNDDFTIADCENVYSDSKKLKVSDKGQYADPNVRAFWFKSPAKNAKILLAGGIDMVSISNNHINDYGLEGHEDTRKALDAANVKWGEEGKIVYFEKHNFKIAVICVSMYGDYVLPTIQSALKKAEKKSDYQIIYFHGGTEGLHEPESWKVNACHTLIDSGADLIIGDHPHVLQPLEKYKNKTIIYSMGNFIFGGNRHPENRTIIYQHTITLTSNNKVSKETGDIIPCYVYTGDTNNWQPAQIKDKATKKKVLSFMNGKRKSPL